VIENKTALIKNMVRDFYPFAKQKMGFNRPVRLFLRHDPQNATEPLGKTAFYDPENFSITVYTVDRHPKDIVRSIAHELVHHKQNCEGRLTNVDTDNITESSHLKNLEEEAYRDGNSCFREWEDTKKSKPLMENKTMNEKKEGEYSGDITENDTIKEYYVTRADRVAEHMNNTLAKKFGFKFNLDNLENTQKGGDSK
jgi:hypothetical protein